MSYNPTLIKIIEIDALIIPLSSLAPEGSEWSSVVETSGTDGSTTYLQGDILGGEFLQVNNFDCTGECSGSCMREVFEPAFRESTGKLVAVVVWEGGDSIQTLTVEGGKVSFEPYEFGVLKQSPVKHSGITDREKTARFIDKQLEAWQADPDYRPEKSAHHYGKCELWDLLDFIYGGAPSNDTEKINMPDSFRGKN